MRDSARQLSYCLHFARLLKLFAHTLPLYLQLLALRDIPADPDYRGHPALIIQNRAVRPGEPAPSLSGEYLLFQRCGVGRPQERLHGRAGCAAPLTVGERQESLTQNLILCSSKGFMIDRTGKLQPPLRIELDHHIVLILDQQTVTRLTLFQGQIGGGQFVIGIGQFFRSLIHSLFKYAGICQQLPVSRYQLCLSAGKLFNERIESVGNGADFIRSQREFCGQCLYIFRSYRHDVLQQFGCRPAELKMQENSHQKCACQRNQATDQQNGPEQFVNHFINDVPVQTDQDLVVQAFGNLGQWMLYPTLAQPARSVRGIFWRRAAGIYPCRSVITLIQNIPVPIHQCGVIDAFIGEHDLPALFFETEQFVRRQTELQQLVGPAGQLLCGDMTALDEQRGVVILHLRDNHRESGCH